MNKFLNFDNLITTNIIKTIYLIGVFVITIGGIVMMAQGGSGAAFVLIGLLGIILGNLLWRVFCENIIVLFNIHDNLSSINDSIE